MRSVTPGPPTIKRASSGGLPKAPSDSQSAFTSGMRIATGDAIVLLDEAYIHFSDNAKPATDLVNADKDIIVLRTFSKIYGMAGLRAGFAVARPDLLENFSTVAAPARSLASISITSAAGARAGCRLAGYRDSPAARWIARYASGARSP